MHEYRTIWISDVHLGTPQCKADMLLDFLRDAKFETLYLVGDFIDIVAMKRKIYWRQDFWIVIQKILRFSRKGAEIRYICGNHDALFLNFLDDNGFLSLESIKICNRWHHTTAKGKRLLVIHGDEFDGAIRSMPWLYWLGDRAYYMALFFNNIFNWWRRFFGLSYWSISAYLKKKVKKAVSFVANFEKFVVARAHKEGVDGVVCGHIHTPQVLKIGSVCYYNDGDWCENCTALVEDLDGSLRLVNHRHESLNLSELNRL